MRVVSCILTQHDLRLVLLAALVCTGGCWVALGLFGRAKANSGLQRNGWIFLAAVAAGSSIWCTHFIAILAYDVRAPITFDPLLTMWSLLAAIIGCGGGFYVASTNKDVRSSAVGGALVGLSIVVMHYAGMIAYRVDGIVQWNGAYMFASLVLSVTLAALALSLHGRREWPHSDEAALGVFVLGVVALHFTAMAAVSVMPLITGAPLANHATLQGMAVAVAGATLIVAGAGVASYLIDARTNQSTIDKLRHMALSDALTGLPNRTRYGDHLTYELNLAKDIGGKLAAIRIDLDRFKDINDLRGHDAGDTVLKIISHRLQNILGDGEFVARVGGDEFAAAKRFSVLGDLQDFVSRLENALSQPIRTDKFEVVTGGSLGVAIYPDDANTLERLVCNADLAMYRAKADVTRATCYYEAQMDEAARERQLLGQDLKRAIELNQLELHYQVQNSVSTGEICGYEVLLRWKHPERGRVPPATFIPVAEETGAILEIGEWVLRTACREAAKWNDNSKIAINLSPVQLAHIDVAHLVHEVLIDTGLSPRRLELELTESAIVADKARTLHTLRQIKALGATIAIDDFGTGYSSLDTLRSFPFDRIKLDRSFIREVEHSQQAKAIVRAVLALGKTLDIAVLAEGVETHHQLAILRQEGCDEAQGFFFGRPSPVRQTKVPGSESFNDEEQSLPGRMPLASLERRRAS